MVALPFAIMAAIGVARVLFGSTWGLLPLLAVGPAVAAAASGLLATLAAGGMAMGEDLMFAVEMHETFRSADMAFLAAAGVTAAGVGACLARQRRDRELAQMRVVAEAAQQVLLRPVPRQIGSVMMAVRYLSASSGARVGGDLYEVVGTPGRVRLIVGDVEGKGLPAIQSAAAVVGVFREAAHDDIGLAEIAARIETSLAREFTDEQFVTAVLADLTLDDAKMDMLSCGHPAPALLGTGRPRFIGRDESGLPLGLGQLTGAPRIPLTVPFGPGDRILFYTDGATEARNKAGQFFSLTECESLCGCSAAADPAVVVERLSNELIRHVGHAPDDDVALLLAHRLATPTGLGGARSRGQYTPDYGGRVQLARASCGLCGGNRALRATRSQADPHRIGQATAGGRGVKEPEAHSSTEHSAAEHPGTEQAPAGQAAAGQPDRVQPGAGHLAEHPALAPVRFLLGHWEGAGVVGYPTIESARFGQEIEFSHNGKPFLIYSSRTWLLSEEGGIGQPLAMETGYWRPQPGGEIEVLLVHPTGIAEIYLGQVTGTKIEMATDAVMRTSTAKEVTAGRRLYGLIGTDLGYAYDMAAMGQPLQAHASAQLKRVG